MKGRVYATSEGWLNAKPVWTGRKRGIPPFVRWGVTTWTDGVRKNQSLGMWYYHLKGRSKTCPKCQ